MSSNVFNTVQMRKPSANWFNLSHQFKFSTDLGVLTPVVVEEVLPGDVFNMQSETLIRFAPMVAPVMHTINVFTHYFFVPNRIIWPNWEAFISPDLSKDVPPAWPYLNFTGALGESSLADYLGLPTGVGAPGIGQVSALPFAAYQCIYNEYYRDQNLVAAVDYKLTNGGQSSNVAALQSLRRRSWNHDYFTSALPFAQKGPAVDIPIGTFDDVSIYKYNASPPSGVDSWATANDHAFVEDTNVTAMPGGATENYLYAQTSDLTQASATTINDLRVAMRLQEWFEKAARGGSRYVEQLQVHWNVRSSDARLNRPEFLGGVKNPVIISEVLQTSQTGTTPLASMGGHGISAAPGKRIRYRAEEHGFIIGIMSVMPLSAYQQGLPRKFTRESWEDYAWPTFAHLGEQAILNKELYAGTDGLDNDVFGYIPRYSEYRYTPSRVSGAFRSTLSFWHLGRIFANRPLLNGTFVTMDNTADTMNRIFAVSSGTGKLWCHVYHNNKVYRKLPKYGTPLL